MNLKQLEIIVSELNTIRGFKKEVYNFDKTTKVLKTNPNVFYVKSSCGGYMLCQTGKKGKGSIDRTIKATKKQIYQFVHYMIEGYYMAKTDERSF
tara:strand:- start:216 stop:500 length:285 start_codon:yes stop_codon:yes gene_type:complete